MVCEQCTAGHDNPCPNWQPICVGREGGYATHIRVDSRFAFPIPDDLPSEFAAPLLCGGITVFAPMLRHAVAGNSRLGVIGIGGLGHVALQYGRALGCHVIAFSSSPTNRACSSFQRGIESSLKSSCSPCTKPIAHSSGFARIRCATGPC